MGANKKTSSRSSSRLFPFELLTRPMSFSSSALPPPDVAEGPLEDCYKWFLANLSFSSTPQDIKTFFGEFGRVNFVKIVYDSKLKKSKGYGFLYMMDAQGDAAVDDFARKHENRITLLGQSRVMLQRHDQNRVQPIRNPKGQTPPQYSQQQQQQAYPQPYIDERQPVYLPQQPAYSDGYAQPPLNGYSQSPQGHVPSSYAAPGYYEVGVQNAYSQGQYSQGSAQDPYSQGQYSQGSGQYSQAAAAHGSSAQDPYLHGSLQYSQDPYSQGSLLSQYSQNTYSQESPQYSQGQTPTPPYSQPYHDGVGSYNVVHQGSSSSMAPRQLYSAAVYPPRPSRPPRVHENGDSGFRGPPPQQVTHPPRPSRPPRVHGTADSSSHGPPPPRRHGDSGSHNGRGGGRGRGGVDSYFRGRGGRGRGGRHYDNRHVRRERPY